LDCSASSRAVCSAAALPLGKNTVVSGRISSAKFPTSPNSRPSARRRSATSAARPWVIELFKTLTFSGAAGAAGAAAGASSPVDAPLAFSASARSASSCSDLACGLSLSASACASPASSPGISVDCSAVSAPTVPGSCSLESLVCSAACSELSSWVKAYSAHRPNMTATAMSTIAKPRSGNVVAVAPAPADWLVSCPELSTVSLVTPVTLVVGGRVFVRGTPNFFAFSTFSKQPFYQHRVIGQGCWKLHNHVEALMVTHRRNIQLSANRFFFQRNGFGRVGLKIQNLLIEGA